jgi:hypothetical protein
MMWKSKSRFADLEILSSDDMMWTSIGLGKVLENIKFSPTNTRFLSVETT